MATNDLDNQNTITLPDGSVVTLSPGSPRSLESYFGVLVRAVREAYEEFLLFAEESCATAHENQPKRGPYHDDDPGPLGQILPFQ